MNLKFRWFILGFLREPETVNKQFGLYKISLENDKLTIFQGYKNHIINTLYQFYNEWKDSDLD